MCHKVIFAYKVCVYNGSIKKGALNVRAHKCPAIFHDFKYRNCEYIYLSYLRKDKIISYLINKSIDRVTRLKLKIYYNTNKFIYSLKS